MALRYWVTQAIQSLLSTMEHYRISCTTCKEGSLPKKYFATFPKVIYWNFRIFFNCKCICVFTDSITYSSCLFKMRNLFVITLGSDLTLEYKWNTPFWKTFIWEPIFGPKQLQRIYLILKYLWRNVRNCKKYYCNELWYFVIQLLVASS